MKNLPRKKVSLSPLQLRLCSYFIALTLFYFLAVDSFGSAMTVFKLTGIESHRLIIPAFVALFYLRWRIGSLFSQHIERVFIYIFLFLTVMTSLLTIYNVFTSPNAVFALTKLHLSQLWLLCVVLLSLLLLNQSDRWWKSYWKGILFITPLACFYAFFVASYFPFDFFDQLINEDRLVEYGQFWILILGVVSCGSAGFYFLGKKRAIWGTFFFLCAGILTFIAGDEIAWGQRIFGIPIHDTIKALNRQEELTVHNLHAVEWLVALGYVAIALFGISGRFFIKKLSTLQPLWKKYVELTPDKFLYTYFFLPLIFFVAQLVVRSGIWHQWSEVAELCLYSGVVLWLMMAARKLQSILIDS